MESWKGKFHLEDEWLDGGIILKWMLKEQCVRTRAGLCLRLWNGGGLSCKHL